MSYPFWSHGTPPYPNHMPNFTVHPVPRLIHPQSRTIWSPDTSSYPDTPLLELDPHFPPPPALLPRPSRKSTKSKPTHPGRALSNVSINTTHPSNHPPSPALLPIPIKNNTYGSLLTVPPEAHLEVNGLLLLKPPTLPPLPDGTQQPPLNQYNRDIPGFGEVDQHESQYEQYTCRVCRRTYDGKNARSVARRHLQDKHGVPLAAQERRTRWDTGEYERSQPSYESYH